MAHFRFLAAACMALLLLASPALAQKKQKDPVLQTYLEETFAELTAKLLKLADRLAAIEDQLTRLKQQQDDAGVDVRGVMTQVKTTDQSLSSFRLSVQQDLLSLKSDLASVRQDLKTVAETAKKAEAAPAQELPRVEGYITAVTEKDVTINLGSASGMKAGTRLAVFRASDPKTQIGVIEVTEVLDANNSRAKIVFSKPDAKFDFSDIVRPD
jgi:hypothetical protein